MCIYLLTLCYCNAFLDRFLDLSTNKFKSKQTSQTILHLILNSNSKKQIKNVVRKYIIERLPPRPLIRFVGTRSTSYYANWVVQVLQNIFSKVDDTAAYHACLNFSTKTTLKSYTKLVYIFEKPIYHKTS